MRFWKSGTLYLLSLTAILITFLVLIQPVRVLAASCSAKCAKKDITVEGTYCSCTDYQGCMYYDPHQQQEVTKSCDSQGELE